jgi:hypothetical protein
MVAALEQLVAIGQGQQAQLQELIMIAHGLEAQFGSKTVIPAENQKKHKRN